MTGEVAVYWLGQIDYAEAHALQERLVEARIQDQIPDSLLLLEHGPVFTLGRRTKPEHLRYGADDLKSRGFDVFDTGRGGDVTYHGPGQLVAYPIVDLGPGQRDVVRYVWNLEEVMIQMTRAYGLEAARMPEFRGVWIEDRKIGAVGVRVRRWVTMHGMALNVNTDLSAYDLIVPCGIRDKEVTSLSRELGHELRMDEVVEVAGRKFGEVFAARVVWQDTQP